MRFQMARKPTAMRPDSSAPHATRARSNAPQPLSAPSLLAAAGPALFNAPSRGPYQLAPAAAYAGARAAPSPRYRKAGAGAPVVQRQLDINDVKQSFTDKSSAAAYLTEKYQDVLASSASDGTARPLTFGELGRLDEMAQTADDTRYTYPISSLADAMDYIDTAKPIDIVRLDSDPGKTPVRMTDDTTPWNFVLYKNAAPPTTLRIPQSPTHESFFPSDSTPASETVDLRSGFTHLRSNIETWQTGIPKSKLGQNHYTYELEIKYRLQPLESATDLGGSTGYKPGPRAPLSSASASSPYYTSKMKLPPQSKGDKVVDMEPKMRAELSHLHQHSERGEFKKTSLYANDKKTGARTKTPAYYAKATNSQLSSLYYHSEVQAAADADGAKKGAAKAVNDMVMEAMIKKKAGSYELVVAAVLIKGFSHDRTVCGNACKPALAHLSEIIETEVRAQINAQKTKPIVASNELFVRRSRYFTVSAHVGAGKEFQGLETGAKTGIGTPSLEHHNVNEYQPF